MLRVVSRGAIELPRTWSKRVGAVEQYATAYATEVEVGNNTGRGITSEASQCTHEEFLVGRFHDTIREHLGAEVLEEIIALVRAISTTGRS
jgi:hypothetical protein